MLHAMELRALSPECITGNRYAYRVEVPAAQTRHLSLSCMLIALEDVLALDAMPICSTVLDIKSLPC